MTESTGIPFALSWSHLCTEDEAESLRKAFVPCAGSALTRQLRALAQMPQASPRPRHFLDLSQTCGYTHTKWGVTTPTPRQSRSDSERMRFPERFSNLPDYAFPRLRKLLAGHAPGGDVVDMTIGEPRHAMPGFVAEVVAAHVADFAKYPPNDGTPELRGAICDWLGRRYGVRLDPETQVMALNGTREGLFAATT